MIVSPNLPTFLNHHFQEKVRYRLQGNEVWQALDQLQRKNLIIDHSNKIFNFIREIIEALDFSTMIDKIMRDQKPRFAIVDREIIKKESYIKYYSVIFFVVTLSMIIFNFWSPFSPLLYAGLLGGAFLINLAMQHFIFSKLKVAERHIQGVHPEVELYTKIDDKLAAAFKNVTIRNKFPLEGDQLFDLAKRFTIKVIPVQAVIHERSTPTLGLMKETRHPDYLKISTFVLFALGLMVCGLIMMDQTPLLYSNIAGIVIISLIFLQNFNFIKFWKKMNQTHNIDVDHIKSKLIKVYEAHCLTMPADLN